MNDDEDAGQFQAMHEVLEARARLFAQRGTVVAEPLPSSATQRALILQAGGERYALALTDVQQVARAGQVTPLPGAPATLAGIINFRGAVFSVMDLAQIFTGLPTTSQGKLIFLRTPGVCLALLADEVEAIVPYDEIQRADAAPAHIAGMISPGLPLIDMSALLQHPAFAPGRLHNP